MIVLFYLFIVSANGSDNVTGFATKATCDAAAAWINSRDSAQPPRAACFPVQ